MGKEDKQVKQHYYVTSSQKLSHTSCVLSCSLVYCIFGLSADMGGIVISWDSEVRVSYRRGGGLEEGGTWEGKRSGGVGEGE